MGAAVRVHDLAVTIDGHCLLDSVSLSVETGEWVVVLGPNGAGKTTLLRTLAGLQNATSGEIEILGRPFHTLRPRDRARLVALVPQHPVIPPGMRVVDYVLLGRTPHLGMFAGESDDDVRQALDALDTLHLTAMAERLAGSLSGGELQRVVLARAIAQDSPVLLLDEPTTSLDIGHQQEVLELVDALRAERDVTVIATMHDLTLAGQYGDRLVLLRRGEVVTDGLAVEVMTAENLSRYYDANVGVVDGPDGLIVVPRRARATRPPGGSPP